MKGWSRHMKERHLLSEFPEKNVMICSAHMHTKPKTRTENFKYKYMYHYTPNILCMYYIYIYIYICMPLIKEDFKYIYN